MQSSTGYTCHMLSPLALRKVQEKFMTGQPGARASSIIINLSELFFV